ncbi:MAG: hypothetical protein NVSMB45_11520 [Ginsengibacter sp.]
MIKLRANLFFLVVVCICGACKKVIQIDLNSSSPRIVIEANISNQPGPYTVKLSRSVNFNQSNVFPPISGAKVKLSDEGSVVNETLIETSPGTYKSKLIKGIAGHTYLLSVTDNGKVYEASSYLPQPVDILELTVEQSFDRDKRINVSYSDPAGIPNYYRCIEIVNDTTLSDISVDNDLFKDGAVITQTISNDLSKYKLKRGDRVTVLLQTIDKGTYEYFRTLANILLQDGSSGPPPTTPSNPLSPFTNNALGYFNTYSVTSKSITLP